MKITKSQLRRIIREEIEAIKESGTGRRGVDLMYELKNIMDSYGVTSEYLRGVLDNPDSPDMGETSILQKRANANLEALMMNHDLIAADLLGVLDDVDEQWH